jgi:prepilin peptidase CpaA
LTLPLILALIAFACLVGAAIFDVATFEIPDTLSIVLLATALGYGGLTPGFDWLSHGLALLLMFGIGLLLFSRGWMGGGDIKIMVAVAAWTGLEGLPLQLAYVAIAGGGLALVLIIVRRGLAAAGRAPDTLPKLFQMDAPLPYAVAILIGTTWWAALNWPI